jgi:hypothetical protein
MEVLDVNSIYSITSAGLDNITRMIESTQLKTNGFDWNDDNFNDQSATENFVSTLEQKKSTVQELPRVPINIRAATYGSIQRSLIRKQQLNRVALLLVPPPPRPLRQQQQQQPHATSMMLKTS